MKTFYASFGCRDVDPADGTHQWEMWKTCERKRIGGNEAAGTPSMVALPSNF